MTKIFGDFGVSKEELEATGQALDSPVTDIEVAKYLATALSLSIYIVRYNPGNPIAEPSLIVKLASPANAKKKADFITIVQLPDERVGLLSLSQEPGPIPFDTLPIVAKAEIHKVPTLVL
jgi:hypothetical protein